MFHGKLYDTVMHVRIEVVTYTLTRIKDDEETGYNKSRVRP